MILNITRLVFAMLLGVIVSSVPGCSPGERDPDATTDGTNVSKHDDGHNHDGDDHDGDENEARDK